MAQNDIFKRYLDAGMAFTQVSRERAEEFVKDLVKAGEVRRKEAEEVVETLLERSRKNTEDLVTIIRQEIADQLRGIGLEDIVKRAGLPGSVAERAEDAAGDVDDAAEDLADAVEPEMEDKKAARASEAKKAGAKKAAAEAPAVPSPGSPLVVPGAPKRAPAKKLVVPAGTAAPATKTGAAKKASKSSKKS